MHRNRFRVCSLASPASFQLAACACQPPGLPPAARLPQPTQSPSLPVCRPMVTMPRSQIDVLIADIGGTNCRFQVWQLDTHFRPSRMVVEQVGAGGCRGQQAGAMPLQKTTGCCMSLQRPGRQQGRDRHHEAARQRSPSKPNRLSCWLCCASRLLRWPLPAPRSSTLPRTIHAFRMPWRSC